jgi:FAD/FMN-containing dehydrogenase
MVGGATPDAGGGALLLSMRRMRQVRSIEREAGYAVCEAGVILAELHDAAAMRGRASRCRWQPRDRRRSAGSSHQCGRHAGAALRHHAQPVLGIEAVLPDGSLFDSLVPLRKDNRGYNLTHLLVGAEGTLGVVTAASLKLVPAVGSRAVAWVGLASAQDALRLLGHMESVVGDAVESFELIPASSLDLVLEHVPGTRPPLQDPHPWHVLLEVVAPIAAPPPDKDVYSAVQSALELGIAADAVIAANEAQAEALWRLRETISEAEKKDGPAAKHDISVAVPDMPAFMTQAAAAVEQRFPGTRVNAFGHLGDGNVHFNVRAPVGAGEHWLEEEGGAVTCFVHDLVTDAGGSISAEHGIGQMKLASWSGSAAPDGWRRCGRSSRRSTLTTS